MPSESMLAAGNMLVELFNMVGWLYTCVDTAPGGTDQHMTKQDHVGRIFGCVRFVETQMINSLISFFSRLMNRWKV